jgi:hypothetical protein
MERRVSDDPIGEGGRPTTRPTTQVFEEGFELAKAIRGELFGYLGKAAVGLLVLVAGFIGTVLWAYLEWRLPKIAGGVPKGAVLAFNTEICPDGWERLKGGGMRVIVGATETDDADNTRPRRLHFHEQRGAYSEYVFVKAPHDGKPAGDNEQHVAVPGLFALTYCEKTHE